MPKTTAQIRWDAVPARRIEQTTVARLAWMEWHRSPRTTTPLAWLRGLTDAEIRSFWTRGAGEQPRFARFIRDTWSDERIAARCWWYPRQLDPGDERFWAQRHEVLALLGG